MKLWPFSKETAPAVPALKVVPVQDLRLPAWATVVPAPNYASIKIEVDSAAAYEEWLKKLGVSTPDQYWLETAYQCMKMQLQDALTGTQFDPRISGKPAEFRFRRSDAHALARHPAGRGTHAATQGKEARGHFKRIHGRLPW